MSYGTNIWVGTGRLTRDPEIKMTRDNAMIAVFTLAVSCGEADKTLFMDCTAFRKTAEVVQKYTNKGKQVTVVGKLRHDKWTSKEGEKKSAIRCNVDSVELLSDGKGGAPAQVNPSPVDPQKKFDQEMSEPLDENQEVPF